MQVTKILLLAAIGSFALMESALAATVVKFTNNEVNLGTAGQINLTNQYAAYGLKFTDVYRYIDRDPFSDAPNQVNGFNLGISNGRVDQNFVVNTVGRVDFINSPVISFTFDWWTLRNALNVKAFDRSGILQSSFLSARGSGTNTLTGNIAYFTFQDNGGFVQIANLSYESVPEPLTMLGAGTALGFGSSFKRKLSKKQK